jgi:hypothetical protein
MLSRALPPRALRGSLPSFDPPLTPLSSLPAAPSPTAPIFLRLSAHSSHQTKSFPSLAPAALPPHRLHDSRISFFALSSFYRESASRPFDTSVADGGLPETFAMGERNAASRKRFPGNSAQLDKLPAIEYVMTERNRDE